MSGNKTQKTWFNYAVSLSLGIAFSITMFFITWNNSINTKAREFSLASSSIKDTVARNVQTANDTLNSLSSFLEVNPGLSQQQYSMITSSLLGMHPFMEGAVYVTRNNDTQDQRRPYRIHYSNMRTTAAISPAQELLDEQAYANAIDILYDTDSVITLDSEFDRDGWKGYWILRAISTDVHSSSTPVNFGFVAILINTNKIVGTNISNTDLSIMLLSDSASLSGRQMLYQNEPKPGNGWMVSQLLEESITQFPFYSVKLSVKKNIPWSEIEKTMIFISLLIGAGVTLLLIALVKSRNEQEQQLRERNAIIEAQVYAQTEELARTRDQALEASLMKSSFLASMSHEIRTPLNAIIGMSDLLSETELDFEQKKYVAVFKKAGDTLLSLVNDILDLSKIEADQLKLEEIEFNLVDTIEESVEIYALKASEKSIELLCDIQPDIFPVRHGDPSRLRQVLLNLISNALKFTDNGQIKISVKSGQDHESGHLQISVSDTGTGIPEDKLEKIFESFSQADSSTTRKYGGTGLGLTISRRLIEMMGGKIWVESQLGQGSRFIVDVSIPVIEDHRENNPDNRYHLDGEVLIVDDNPDTGQVLETYLNCAGANTVCLGSAGDAMTFLGKEDSRSKVGLILLDAEMPGTDGFTLFSQIRDEGIAIPILMMLNPATLNQNHKHLNKLGIDHLYLTKPVKSRELFRLIDTVFNKGSDKGQEVDVGNTVPVEKELHILLVDDNPDNRLLVKAYLKKLPYHLEEAENGQEAVEKFTGGAYDLVLMDVQMPVMDGRESTRQIRKWEQKNSRKPTPIIALTAHAIKEEIDLCIEAGCDSHLSKPVKKSTLVTTIQSVTATV